MAGMHNIRKYQIVRYFGSGGGATAIAEVPDYMEDAHGLILSGRTSDNNGWSGYSIDSAIQKIAIAVVGADYEVNDVLFIANIYGGDRAEFTVTAVDGAGGITELAITVSGTNYEVSATEWPLGYVTGSGGTGGKVVITTVGDIPYDKSAAYATAPSVMRFVVDKGITDVGGNPFEGVSSYAPDSDLAYIRNNVQTFITAAQALAPSTDWDTSVDLAVALKTVGVDEPNIEYILGLTEGSAGRMMRKATEAAAAVIDDAPVEELVDSFTKNKRKEYLRSVGRFAGGMADINAVNSSAFIFGLALLESDNNDAIAAYRAQVRNELYQAALRDFALMFQVGADGRIRCAMQTSLSKNDFVKASVDLMNAMNNSKLEALRAAAILSGDVGRTTIVAKKEQYESDLEYDSMSAAWDVELFQKAANVLSAVTGSVVPTAGKPSKTQSTLAGMAAGGGVGANIASTMLPAAVASGPIGWALLGVGALGGAIAGSQ